jgi:hypothetical protein
MHLPGAHQKNIPGFNSVGMCINIMGAAAFCDHDTGIKIMLMGQYNIMVPMQMSGHSVRVKVLSPPVLELLDAVHGNGIHSFAKVSHIIGHN